jgi:hemerythrin-like domain-containing protein
MKRSPALLKLSREHHTALSLALRIERGGDAATQAALLAALPLIFRNELEPHFQEEENALLPQLRQAGEEMLVDRTLAEHGQLRQLVEQIAGGDLASLQPFGELLRAHVRFEERELFLAAERVLPADYLQNTGNAPSNP